ncbi:histidine phosphatase family protein [Iodobacter sp. LRB]|uniref:SixA phosphatase family protein n=1 Tax=unclassified Iodobacter TaxID=235634 RepID=UPI000C114EE1|nr:histidine phosphatase family protein [Iodobacter sp. BJB302]PHV00808.1 histidine phosphatase family protein [Iodobacter sp. BJB302]
MDLILWRHAEAEEGADDLRRPLTAKGRKQAEKMAAWLSKRLDGGAITIIASEAVRSQETAKALSKQFKIDARLNPGVLCGSYLEVSNWPREPGKTIVLVGHQPELGRAAAVILAGKEHDWELRRGGCWWLQRRVKEGQVSYLLRMAMSPDLL